MKRIVPLVLALACLVGCTKTPDLPQDVEQTVTTSVPAKAPAPDRTPAKLTVGYAPPWCASPDLDAAGSDAYAQPVDVMFYTDRAITEFRIVRINYDAESGRESAGEVLLERDRMAPEDDALILRMSFIGLMPTLGVTYTDTDGSSRFFGITMSGQDGRVLLAEIIPQPTVTMAVTAASSTGATITLTETAGGEATYGRMYILERLVDGEWRSVPYLTDNVAWEAIGIILMPNAVNEEKLGWKNIYGSLGKGQYRVVKDVSGMTLYAEFSLD